MKLTLTKHQGVLIPSSDIDAEKLAKLKNGTSYSVEIKDKRTLDQNALLYKWYDQIDTIKQEGIGKARQYCKLEIGVPILRGESPEFCEQYDSLIKNRFAYDEKLKLMDWFPITSLMSKPQFSRYLDEMQKRYAEQGIILTNERGEL